MASKKTSFQWPGYAAKRIESSSGSKRHASSTTTSQATKKAGVAHNIHTVHSAEEAIKYLRGVGPFATFDFGPFSAVVMILMLGIIFIALGRHRWTSLSIAAICIVGHLAIAVPIMAGWIDDVVRSPFVKHVFDLVREPFHIPALVDEQVPPLFPLPEVVLFPGARRPLVIYEPRYRDMVADALTGNRIIGTVLLRPGFEANYEGRPPIYAIGCAGVIEDYQRLTSEGKLGEAGQRLESLKQKLQDLQNRR